jgi:hypothetical protein
MDPAPDTPLRCHHIRISNWPDGAGSLFSAKYSPVALTAVPSPRTQSTYHPPYPPYEPYPIFHLPRFLRSYTWLPWTRLDTARDGHGRTRRIYCYARPSSEVRHPSPLHSGHLQLNLLPYLEDPQASPPSKWHAIATHVPNRTNKDCRKRWWAQMATQVSKGGWSAEEDDKLCAAVEQFGTKSVLLALVYQSHSCL